MGAAGGKNNTSYVKTGDNTAQETTRNELTFYRLLITLKALRGLAQSYISELLLQYKPMATLRSAGRHRFTGPSKQQTGNKRGQRVCCEGSNTASARGDEVS